MVEGWMWIGKKNSISDFICHLSWFKKLSPTHTHALISICKFLKPYKFLEFESFVKCKIWIVKGKSLNDFFCHMSWLKNLFPTHIHPLISICEFLKPYELLFFLVWVICKLLNANWDKIDSIIFSFTCHSLRNIPLLMHIPSYPFMNFQNPMSYYLLS